MRGIVSRLLATTVLQLGFLGRFGAPSQRDESPRFKVEAAKKIGSSDRMRKRQVTRRRKSTGMHRRRYLCA